MSASGPTDAAAGATSDRGDQLGRVEGPLRLVHQHAGYVRVQADAFVQAHDETPVVAAARAAVAAVAGFRSWTHNPKSGSVVIEYDPAALESDDLLACIATRAGFRTIENATSRPSGRGELVGVILDAVQGVNQVASQLAAERADLRELVPIALAATSVVSFVLNDPTSRIPEWSSALYRSYLVFVNWHQDEARSREAHARGAEASGTADDAGTKAR